MLNYFLYCMFNRTIFILMILFYCLYFVYSEPILCEGGSVSNDNESIHESCYHSISTNRLSLCGAYGLTNSISKGRIICSFTLKQIMIDKSTGLSCVPFMTKLANLFECKINYKGKNEIVFVVQANSKHHLVKSYFDKFPLMSSKYLDYLCYLQRLDYLGKHLTSKEIVVIQIIKNSMNNHRIFYNWDHLNNIYI